MPSDFDQSFDIGEMRHRLSYQVKQSGLDAFHQASNQWTTLGTYWAKVEPLSGMELMNARQLKATTSHKIIMRNVNPALSALTPPAAITPSGRFLFEATARIFGIEQVFRIGEQNAFLALHCSELKAPQ